MCHFVVITNDKVVFVFLPYSRANGPRVGLKHRVQNVNNKVIVYNKEESVRTGMEPSTFVPRHSRKVNTLID